MEYDYSKLRGRIVEKYGDIRKFSKVLGRSATSTYKYLNNQSHFNQPTIERWCAALELPFEEGKEYFFKIKV